jgi:hypothetical protein
MKQRPSAWRKAVRRWGPPLAYVAGGFAAAASVALVEERGERDLALPTRSAESARMDATSTDARLEALHPPVMLARAPIAVDPVADLFPPPPAPPPPPMPQAPPPAARAKPQAPPFTYSYVGRMEEDGVTRLLLARGDALVIVSPGEKIEGGFRVDRIDDDSITVSHAGTRTTRKLSLDMLAAQRAPAARAAPTNGLAPSQPGYGSVQPQSVDPPIPEPAITAPEPMPPMQPAFVPPAPAALPPSPIPGGADAGGMGGAATGMGGVTIGGSSGSGGAMQGFSPQPVVPIYVETNR